MHFFCYFKYVHNQLVGIGKHTLVYLPFLFLDEGAESSGGCWPITGGLGLIACPGAGAFSRGEGEGAPTEGDGANKLS